MALKGPCTWPPKGGVASRLTCRRLKRLMSGILFLGILDLIYDVLFDGFFVNIAHRLCIVSTRPKAAIPFAPHVRVLVKYHQRGLPFQVSNKVRYAQLRRNVYAQMYMICTYRPRYDFYFFVLAQCTDDLSYIVSHFSVHYLFPVLRYKHYMVWG